MAMTEYSLRAPFSVAALSLLAIPFAYAAANIKGFHDHPTLVLLVGLAGLALPAIVAYGLVFRRLPERARKDPFLYIFTIFAFACILDLMIGLDLAGFTDIMSWYFASGEPYLNTAHGMSINLWDGVVHYALYLWMSYCLANNLDFRRAGLFWTGSMSASTLVFLQGNLVGEYAASVEPSYLLNVPFMLVPLFLAWRFFTAEQDSRPSSSTRRTPAIDTMLSVALLGIGGFTLLRTLVVLNPGTGLTMGWASMEPYLMSPLAYPRVQMLLYGFVLMPFCAIAAMALWHRASSTLANWGWILLGAVFQGQFAILVGSISTLTPAPYRMQHDSVVVVLANVTLLATVLLFTLHYERRVPLSR